tara:strand:+ start:97 stop:1314 length:1218 start_codon:yes stop_codon:yes gene_type:complete
MKSIYNGKFSIPHYDSTKNDDWYFRAFENSSEQYKKEVYDIYFGSSFNHGDLVYGNTMGVDASKGQYRNLLKIQDKYAIPISLTLNEMNRPIELIRPELIKDFVSYIKKYYDDGVRSCTISHTHLMRTGALQSAFPDMDWKNTVNHGIKSTQEFIDYVVLGYTTIQLDRNFNRNRGELKRVKKEADRLGVKTCLLIKEDCMPECPFKTEHDCWQSGPELRNSGMSYWEAISFTCNKWRTLSVDMGTQEEKDSYVINPRTGTDIICNSSEDWKEFSDLVDIFKKSGRLISSPEWAKERFEYYFQTKFPETRIFSVDSFKEVYENNLAPMHMWFSFAYVNKDFPTITKMSEIKSGVANHFWNKKDAKELSKILKNCKNQCYKCHKCDEVFGTGEIESCLDVGSVSYA